MLTHSDSTLAAMLRDEITKSVELGIEGLIRAPDQRLAGKIEAYRDVLALIDGKVSTLNDIRPTKQEA